MAKNQIRFKTQLSTLTKGGKPCYIVRIVNNGTEYLKDSEQMKEIAREINMSVPFAKTTSEIVLNKAIELALSGYRVETEQLRMYLTARGGAKSTADKWNPERNTLHLVIELKGDLKAKMEALEFCNVTDGVKVSIYSVGDDIYATDGEITGVAGDTVKIACDNAKIVEGRADEGVWLLDREGTVLCRFNVVNSTEQTADVQLPETVAPGEGQIMIASRNGEGLDRGVGVAYRKITIKGPKA